jgi:hypothetical protein
LTATVLTPVGPTQVWAKASFGRSSIA